MQIGLDSSVCVCAQCGAALWFQMLRNDRYSRLHSNMCIHIRAITFSIPARRRLIRLMFRFYARAHINSFRAFFFESIIFCFIQPEILQNASARYSKYNRGTISLSAQHRYLNVADSHISSQINVQPSCSLCRFTRRISIWSLHLFWCTNFFPSGNFPGFIWFEWSLQCDSGMISRHTMDFGGKCKEWTCVGIATVVFQTP